MTNFITNQEHVLMADRLVADLISGLAGGDPNSGLIYGELLPKAVADVGTVGALALMCARAVIALAEQFDEQPPETLLNLRTTTLRLLSVMEEHA